MFGRFGQGDLPAPTRERIALAVAELNAATTAFPRNLLGACCEASMRTRNDRDRSGASKRHQGRRGVRFAVKVTKLRGPCVR